MFEQCRAVKQIMNKYGYPWAIAGGWAIDLFLEEETRPHDDVEIALYRGNQMKAYRYFDKWKKHYINNKSLIGKHIKTAWNKEYLRLPIHEIYVERDGLELEILLNERDEEHWIYRRDPGIQLDAKSAILSSKEGIPYLCPEIVLLYKSKDPREKDLADMARAAPKLSLGQKKWLMDSIAKLETRDRIEKILTSSI